VEKVKKECLPGASGLDCPLLEEYDFAHDTVGAWRSLQGCTVVLLSCAVLPIRLKHAVDRLKHGQSVHRRVQHKFCASQSSSVRAFRSL
jgi:hypothetical protein